MARGITTDLIDGAKEMVSELCTAWAPTLPDLAHADVRLEVTESKVAGVENGEPKFASDDYAFAFGVRFTPASFSAIAALIQRTSSRLGGRSRSEAIRPKSPIASPARSARAPTASATSAPFQNPKAQCALKAAIPASGPR